MKGSTASPRPVLPLVVGSSRAGRTRGQALVEFAFVLMFGLLAMVLTIDIGRFFYEYTAMRGGALMAAAQMQEASYYTGFSTCTDKKNAVIAVMKAASGLSDAPTVDLYGTALTSAELESQSFTPSTCATNVTDTSGLFRRCGQYTILWKRPFLPLAPFSRNLLAVTGQALVMEVSITNKHNNIPGGTTC